MSEFTDICIKHGLFYKYLPMPWHQEAIIRYLLIGEMTIKEYANFRIKEMPFF